MKTKHYFTGIIDKNGDWIVEPTFKLDTIQNVRFSEGLCCMETKDEHGFSRYGYIDKTGKWIIKPKFLYASNSCFSEGLAVARSEDKPGYIVKAGDWVTEKSGYIDKNGNWVIEPQFDSCNQFYEGIAVVQVNGKWGCIDKTGNWTAEPQFELCGSFSEGLAFARIEDKYGCIDKNGNWVIEPQFNSCNQFYEGIAVVQVNGKWGWIDKTGNWIAEPQFESCGSFSEGLAFARIEDKYGYIDKSGKWIINPQFSDANNFSDGVAAVQVNGKWGCIDKTGKWIIKPKFLYSFNFSNSIGIVYIDGKYGCIDKKGKSIVKPQYDKIYPPCDGLMRVMKNNKLGYTRKDGSVLVSPMFYYASDFVDGVALVTIGYSNYEYIQKKRSEEKKSIIQTIKKLLASHNLKNVTLFVKKDGTISLRKRVYLNLTLDISVNEDNYEAIISKLKEVFDKIPQLPKLKVTDAEILPRHYDYLYETKYSTYPKEIVYFYEVDSPEPSTADENSFRNTQSGSNGEELKKISYTHSQSVPKKFKEIQATLDELQFNYAYIKKQGFLIQISSKFTLFIEINEGAKMAGMSIYSNQVVNSVKHFYGGIEIKVANLPYFLRFLTSVNNELLQSDSTTTQWIRLLIERIISEQCSPTTVFAYSDGSENVIKFPFTTEMYICYKFLTINKLLDFISLAPIFAEASDLSQSLCDYLMLEFPEAKLLAKIKGEKYSIGYDIYRDEYVTRLDLKDKVFLEP